MKRFSIIPFAVLAFTPLHSATAQVPVRPGARVRVTGPPICPPTYTICVGGPRLQSVGTFVTWEADSLIMESNGNVLALPLDSVTKLEVSWGRKTNTGMGAGIGFLLGGVVGAVVGYASYDKCVPEGWFSCIGPDFGSEGIGLGGLVIGAIMGGSPEVRLDLLRVSLGLQRDGGFGLGASLSF